MKTDLKITNMKISETDLLYAERLRDLWLSELSEAKEWIEKGNDDATWHWESKEKQQASLETSFDFFLNQTDQRTEAAIIHFVGQEVHDLWNEYPDDSDANRCNHAKALYNFIKSKINKKQN